MKKEYGRRNIIQVGIAITIACLMINPILSVSADSNKISNDREQTIDAEPLSLDSSSLVDEESCECGITLNSGEKLGGGKPIVVGDRSYYVMESEPYLPVLDYEDFGELSLDDPPAEFSWKNYNGGDWTTPARNQGSCGSCWAFGALGAFESAINVERNQSALDLDLSEQYILSCLRSAGSCNGGSPYNALRYIMETSEDGNYYNGIVPETCFSYQASSGIPCSAKCDHWTDFLISISEFGGYGGDDMDVVKNLLMEKGPMTTIMDATQDFASFWATNHDPNAYYPYVPSEGINHCVLLVGWKDDPNIVHGGYWICKNSWGADWGYDGFFNIEYESLNIIDDGTVYWVVPGSIVLYVDNSNTAGPWIGSREYPYRSIQEGINHARDNDTVFAFNGTYDEHVVINKTIKLIGENQDATIIDGNGDEDAVQIIVSNVKIRGFTIQNSDHGIRLCNGSHTINITENTIQNNNYGIYLYNSYNNTISENAIRFNSRGIYLESSSHHNILTENNISSNDNDGIRFFSSAENVITENILSSSLRGLSLVNSCRNSIAKNTIINNFQKGIWAYNSSDNIICYNNFINNQVNAWCVGTNTWNYGYPSGGNYWDDYLGNDLYHGIHQDLPEGDGLGDSPYNIYSENRDNYPLMYPYPMTPVVYIDDDFTQDLSSGWGYNQFHTIPDGINAVLEYGTVYVNSGTYPETVLINKSIRFIGNDSISTNLTGHVEVIADSVTITRFTFNDSGLTIRFNCTNISENIFISSGISLIQSSDTTVIDNTFFSCGIVLDGDNLFSWNTHIINNNYANNRPIRYYKNLSTSSFDVPENTSQVILANCSGILLSSLTITEVDYGIQLGFCSNITIMENTITYCSQGALCIKNSYDNIIYENLLTNNNKGISITSSFFHTISSNYINNSNSNGISLFNSSDNTLSQNILFNNSNGLYLINSFNHNVSENTISFNRVRGIVLSYSFGNNINKNMISNHPVCGLFFANSNSNIIFENEIVNNSQKGIHLIHSSNNHIYHNNFISNSYNANTQNSEGNTWDNGYCSGGNYWSDYIIRYPQAHRIDGIWSTPYIIYNSDNNQDNYPLVEPWNDGPDEEAPIFGDDLTPSNATTGEDIIFLVNVTDNIRVTDVWLYRSQSDELIRPVRMVRNEMTWSYTLTVNLFDAAPIFYFFEAEDSAGNLAYLYHENRASINISDNDPPVTQCEIQWNVMTLLATDNYAGVGYTKYLLARKSDGNYEHVWHDYTGPVALPWWVEMIYFYSADSVNNVETYQSIFLGIHGEVPYDPFPEDPR